MISVKPDGVAPVSSLPPGQAYKMVMASPTEEMINVLSNPPHRHPYKSTPSILSFPIPSYSYLFLHEIDSSCPFLGLHFASIV